MDDINEYDKCSGRSAIWGIILIVFALILAMAGGE